MMRLHIVAVGKVKHPFLEAVEQYEEWLSAYARIETREVKSETLGRKASKKDIEEAKEAEGGRLLEAAEGWIVALDRQGKPLSSEAFAEKLKDIRDFEGGEATFLIGGPHGLPRTVRKKADLVLSFSQMTLPHQLSRVFLLEQLYRAMKIIHGEAYHK